MDIWKSPLVGLLEKAGVYDESKHPRHPKGDKRGGKFAPKSSAVSTFNHQTEAFGKWLPNAENMSYFMTPDGDLRIYDPNQEHENVLSDMGVKWNDFFKAGFARLRSGAREDGLSAQFDWGNKDTAIYLRDLIQNGDGDFNQYYIESGAGGPWESSNLSETFYNKQDAVDFLEHLTEKSMGTINWDDPVLGVLRKAAPGGNVNASPQSGVGAMWNAQAHPRQGAGSERGGEFASKPNAGGGGASGGVGRQSGGFGAQGMMQQPTLPNVFRIYADESGTQANHESWVGVGTEHGFDDTNARILARPLSTLHVAPHTQKLIMQRAREIHDQLSAGSKTPRTSFDTWRYLKAELPFILNVNLPAPEKGKPVAGKAPDNGGQSALRVGGRQSRPHVNDGTKNTLAQRGNGKSAKTNGDSERHYARRFPDGIPSRGRAGRG